jgi:hypothetical protein
MPTIEDLGKKVKTAYPGMYDDLSDSDLGIKVKSKYPGDYNDFTDLPKTIPQPETSIVKDTPMDALKGFGSTLYGGVKGLADMILATQDPQKAYELARGIYQSHMDQAGKAYDSFKQGDYVEAGGHGLAAALPLVGPAAAHAGEQIGQGNIYGGLGESAALIGATPITRGIGKVLSKTGEAIAKTTLPEKLVESAYKFSTTRDPLESANLTSQVLENKLVPKKKNLANVTQIYEELNKKIQDQIGSKMTSEPDVAFSTNEMAKRGQGAASRKFQGANRAEAQATIGRQVDEFRGNRGETMSPLETQQMKTSTYRELGDKAWDQQKTPSAEAQKGIAIAARDMLEEWMPELRIDNTKLGNWLEAEPAIRRAINRIENRDVVGIGLPIKTMAAGPLGLIQAILEMPKTKTRLALLINEARSKMNRGIDTFTNLKKMGAIKQDVTLDEYLMDAGKFPEAKPQGLKVNSYGANLFVKGGD